MSKAKKYLKFMLIAGLVFGLFFSIGAGLTSLLVDYRTETADKEEDEEAAQAKDGKRTDILVLGVDARMGDERSRSDTMLLVSIDPKLNKVAVVSILRDTRVEIQGSHLDKICTANYVGGPEYAVEVVEKLMNRDIQYYVKMDFNGFRDIIDTLGGVNINVPWRMYKPSEDIDLYPGLQKLDGRQALAFVRFRDYINADVDRASQQQEFIKALSKEILQPKTITKLPALMKEINKCVETNLKTSDMLKMATWAPGFNADSVITQTIPGYFYDKRDDEGNLLVSYWVADKDKLGTLVDDMFAGKTIPVVQSSPYPVQVAKSDKKNQDSEEKGESQTNATDSNNTGTPDKDIERSQLPSPGHGGEIEAPPAGTGPEGYI
jgi:LCP family protein required for cell wall assembly